MAENEKPKLNNIKLEIKMPKHKAKLTKIGGKKNGNVGK